MRDTILRTIEQVHERVAGITDGALADEIPELTRADPDHFGIVMVTADGHRYEVGDVQVPFTLQSVSKAFTYGMALHACGEAAVTERVGVEPSGEAFNAISLDPHTRRPHNPMINAGAIAVTALIPDRPGRPRFATILDTFSRYAGRELDWDREVFASESATGFRNRAIANLLRSLGVIGGPVDGIVEDYFRQCAVEVTCADLGVMAATLANSGVNPVTGDRLLDDANVERVLAVMSTCGMYDASGTWVYEVGLPAKSGIGGGVVGVLPGQFGIALYSPPVDAQGSSVRGVAACRQLSSEFDLHLLRAPSLSTHTIRRSYRLSEAASSHARPDVDHAVLGELGRSVLIVELQGDLFAISIERLVHEVVSTAAQVATYIVDLKHTGAIDRSTGRLLRGLATDLAADGKRLLIADPGGLLDASILDGIDAEVTASLDAATLICEQQLLAAAGRPDPTATHVELDAFELTRHLTDHDRARLLPRFTERRYPAGSVIIGQGDDADEVFLLAEGVAREARRSPGSGQHRRVADLYPGVTFGELGLLNQVRRTTSVLATTDVRCFVLTRAQLMQLRSTDHLVYTRIVENLLVGAAERLRRTSHETVMLRG